MTSLYQVILNFVSGIMNTSPELSSAAQLVAICATLAITYYIVLMPPRFVLDLLFKRIKL